MVVPPPRHAFAAFLHNAQEFLSSPRLVGATSACAIGSAVMAASIHQLIGWAGLLGILAALVVLATLSLISSRAQIHWQSFLPISLFTFLGWAGISLITSQYRWATLAGLAYLGVFTILGIYVALLRDTIQIVRLFGNIFRLVLVLSLVIEIFSGLLVDSPITFLGVTGQLDQLGPIQGIMGTRNELGLVSLLALITFGTEYRTKSVSREIGFASMLLALSCIGLSRSPVIAGVLLMLSIAVATLYAVRRVPPARRPYWQVGILLTALLAAVVAWAVRSSIVSALNATGDLRERLSIWHQIWALIALHPLEGWGWIGHWRQELPPFTGFIAVADQPASALNAYLDVWFQLGMIGFVIFVGLLGLTFARSWLLAGRRRSIIFAWPALVLVALITTSLAESSILIEYGWLIFVVCSVKAARSLSWRNAFARTSGDDSPEVL
jgi:O-antigen ligase